MPARAASLLNMLYPQTNLELNLPDRKKPAGHAAELRSGRSPLGYRFGIPKDSNKPNFDDISKK